jgi:hypothetical protein
MIVIAASLAVAASAVAAPVAGASSQAKPHTFSFYARVVRSSTKGLQVRNRAGKLLWFSASQIRRTKPAKPKCSKPKGHKTKKRCKPGNGHRGKGGHTAQVAGAGSITVNVVGLQPGVTVLITETVDSAGNVTITITLPPMSATGHESATGVVTDVSDDAFVLQSSDGSTLRLHMAPDALSNLGLSSCDTASVTYHQDAGMLIADNVALTGSSSAGDCAPTSDATGTITAVSPSGLTISTDTGPVSFTLDSSDVTNGFQVGDVVDVVYTQADGGSPVASDVEYVEQEASGTVTSVGATTLSITDADSGQAETFLAGKNMDIAANVFDGVHVGDSVDVSYHTSGGKLVADAVGDGSSGDGSGGGGG